MRLAALSLLVIVLPAAAQPPAADKALDAVPRDGFAFVTLKVSQAWDHPVAAPIREQFLKQADMVKQLEAVTGVAPADLDRVTLFWSHLEHRGPDAPVVVLTTRRPYNEARVLKALIPVVGGDRPGPIQRAGNTVALRPGGPFAALVFADDTTLVYLPEDNGRGGGFAPLVGQLIARKADGPLAAALAAAGTHHFAAGLDVGQLEGALGNNPNPGIFPFAALLKARTAVVTADLDKTGKAKLTLTFSDAAAAQRGGRVLEEAIADLGREVAAGRKDFASQGPEAEGMVALFDVFAAGLKAAKVEVAGTAVTATTEVPAEKAAAELAAKLPKSFQFAAGNTQAANNLKQILLGMHNYHDAMGRFVSDVMPGAGGKPLAWSWRVQLLPYIEQGQLYSQLNFQLPWDDPANKKILEAATMPKIYEVPGHPAPKNHTYWRSFMLPKGAKPVAGHPWLVEGLPGGSFARIVDGLSNTIMVVEAGESVPWYAPDVLAYDGKLPLPPLGAKDASRFLIGLGDGSVRRVKKTIDEKTLRLLITVDDGFPIPDYDK